MAIEISSFQPQLRLSSFIARVVATRTHHVHRTDITDQVLRGIDLWDTTETVKAMSHMAFLRQVGSETGDMGNVMLHQKFIEYARRD